MSLAPGDRFGRYEIVGELGSGGMGAVFEAVDTALRRHVAVKILQRTQGQASDLVLREARAAARITDPHVIAVFDVGEVDGPRRSRRA